MFVGFLLLILAMACAQSGEILSDAEATIVARPTATEYVDLSGEALYQIGENVTIFGGSYGALVPLFGEPGSRFFSSQINNGALVSILNQALDKDGNIWYFIEGTAGSGWILVENLAPILE